MIWSNTLVYPCAIFVCFFSYVACVVTVTVHAMYRVLSNIFDMSYIQMHLTAEDGSMEWICMYVCIVVTLQSCLGGTQFQSVKLLATMRFPSLLPNQCQDNSDKSWLLMSKLPTSQEFNNHHKFWHCILWSTKSTVKLVYYNNNIDVLIGEWKGLHN
jgi:hypothetical protein